MPNYEQAKFNLELGQRIRASRKKMGMSQKDVASQIGVTFQQLQKYEVGANSISAYRLSLVSRALGENFFSL